MKIAVINGQNHKGSTYHAGRMLAEKLAGGEDIREVFLPKDMPEFCLGCASCILKDEKLCPHYRYMNPILELMEASDLLIFTTPVYVMRTSGSMKAFLDHCAYRFMAHRPEEKMFSKRAVCVSTGAGAGMRKACKDIRVSLFYWGVAKSYSRGFAVAASSWEGVSAAKREAIARRMDKLAKKIASGPDKASPSVKTKLFFYIMRGMQKKGWNPADNAYWKDKGWLDGKKPW
jgi:multimeric flavodoxin WrbA